jgi:peptidoglycan hydrolase CwlO-like protein
MDLRPRSKAVAFSIQTYEADSQDFNKLVDNLNKELRRKGEANAEYTQEDVFQYVFRTFLRQNSDFEKYLAESKKERAGGQAKPKGKAKSKSTSEAEQVASGTAESEETANGTGESEVGDSEMLGAEAGDSGRPVEVAQSKSKKDGRTVNRSGSRDTEAAAE